MPTFIKIKNSEFELWGLKITNSTDIWEYAQYFAKEAWQGAKICVDRINELGEISHIGGCPEAQVLKVMAESKADDKGNFQFKPMEHCAELIDAKMNTIRNMVNDGLEVFINKNGGITPLKAFLETHDAEIAQTIHSEDIVFPSPLDETKYKLIILENDAKTDYDWKAISNPFYDSSVKECCNLTKMSKQQIFHYLTNCDEVIAKTTFLDKPQTELFIKVFASMRGKTIKIVTDFYDSFLKIISENFMLKGAFELAKQQNKIIFYNSNLQIIQQ